VEIRATGMHIIKYGETIAYFTPNEEPNLFIGILNAITSDLRFTAYGEHDVIIKATMYVYDNVKHWLIELAEDEYD